MIDILCHYNNEVFNIKINHDDTLLVLKQLIISNLSSKKIMTESSNLKIIYGFPEKSIDNDDLDNLSLEDLSIFDKEYIKVELKNQNINKENTSNKNMIDYSQYHIKKKDIPADNSCLFNAVNFAINGSAENPEIIRDIIVSEISSNPDQYNAAILGRPPEEYCKWISNKETWGGGIELSILSKFFNIQIGVADIQFITIEYFGNSNKCIYLLYNNIHYDVFYKEENGKISGIFDTYDTNIKREVMDICMQFQKFENFTDLKNFDIKCMQCGELMKGQNEVIEHSKKTGHFNFNEIKK